MVEIKKVGINTFLVTLNGVILAEFTSWQDAKKCREVAEAWAKQGK